MDLPEYLAAALQAEVAALPPKQLARAGVELSQRYRAGQARCGRPMLQSKMEVAAYGMYRLPATFAATHAVLVQAAERKTGWQPRSLLDVGAGPGTATWAATEIWPDVERAQLLENDDRMIDLGKRLSAGAPLSVIRDARWQKADLAAGWEAEPHDLVIASYVLGELPLAHQDDLIARLWSVTADTLVLVEPGTPAGFGAVRRARDRLRDIDALTLAPCPHNDACPMGKGDWCHFAQRLSRTRLHRTAKAGSLSYEDEKFSYAAMSRRQGTPIDARIIRHPQIRPGHVRLELCTPDGLRQAVIAKSDGELFRRARRTRWGSTFPPGAGEHESSPELS